MIDGLYIDREVVAIRKLKSVWFPKCTLIFEADELALLTKNGQNQKKWKGK